MNYTIWEHVAWVRGSFNFSYESFWPNHGVSGLYVTDNSVIPTSGTANPVLTTVALAIRTADYIAEQLR